MHRVFISFFSSWDGNPFSPVQFIVWQPGALLEGFSCLYSSFTHNTISWIQCEILHINFFTIPCWYVLTRILTGQVKNIKYSLTEYSHPFVCQDFVILQLCYLRILFVWTKIIGANRSRILLNCNIFKTEEERQWSA